jgi:undecaprenyl-diphosphatase
MFEIFQAIVLGSIQGITEFLPISSSGHLQIVPWLFGWEPSSLAFDTSLHLGTALAISAYFFKEIIKLIKEKSPLLAYIIVGNIPAIIIGVLGEKYIESFFHEGSYSIPIIATGLILFSLVMWYFDSKSPSDKESNTASLKDLILLGFSQAVALIPGVSRSGITMTVGRGLKFNRVSATYISFLLGMPITVGAGLYKIINAIQDPSQLQEGLVVATVGTITSFLVGVLSIRWLLNFVKDHPLKIFVWYRIIFGVFILVLWTIRT